MSGQGIFQIVLYLVVLVALSYPLGNGWRYVYSDRFRAPRWITAPERGFYRLMGTDPTQEQDWKSYAKVALVFMRRLRRRCSTLLLRLQEHLPLNPDDLPARVAAHRDEHDRQLRHEHELAVLRRRVHDVVPVADGGARRAELRLGGRSAWPCSSPSIRGFSRRSTTQLGNFWVDLYRSIAYILLPLARRPRGDPHLAGRRRRPSAAPRPRTRSRARRRRSRAARSRRRSRSSSSGRTAAASSTRTPPCPFENPNGFTNFLEMLSILLIPAAQVFMFGRMVGNRRQALPVTARCSR